MWVGRGRAHRQIGVHVLVLEAFVGPRPDGMEGCHNDGDPSNNRLSNLRWDTPLANWSDRRKHGRAGKLSIADVEEIRRSDESNLALAARFGVHRAHISRVRSGVRWRRDVGVQGVSRAAELRLRSAEKTYCSRGHSLAVYGATWGVKKQTRGCRRCHADSEAERKRRRRSGK